MTDRDDARESLLSGGVTDKGSAPSSECDRAGVLGRLLAWVGATVPLSVVRKR